MLAGFALLAVAVFAGAAVLAMLHAFPPVVPIHLVFAAGIMPLIAAAMTHFIPVLTRSSTPPIWIRLIPPLLLIAGGLAFFAFAAANRDFRAAVYLALAAATTFAIWIVHRAVRAVGRPHPCLNWYLAAIVCLILALLAISAMAFWPQHYQTLKRLHLHLNTLGFIGLTAVSTLQVLMPTVVGRPDPGVAARLRKDLPWVVGGTLLIALSAAWFRPLVFAGLLFWLVPLFHLGQTWNALYRREILQCNGAAASLAAAYAGFCVILILGALHAFGLLNPADAALAFISAFLLPLVTGALSQLLPVWIRPGVQTAWHDEMRQKLGAWSAYRSLFFLLGGVLAGSGWRGGLLISIMGLLLFMLQLAAAIYSLVICRKP